MTAQPSTTAPVKAMVRQRRASATCRRCRAFDPGGPECALGYATEYRDDEFTKHPAEPCPRPLTLSELMTAKVRRGEIQTTT